MASDFAIALDECPAPQPSGNEERHDRHGVAARVAGPWLGAAVAVPAVGRAQRSSPLKEGDAVGFKVVGLGKLSLGNYSPLQPLPNGTPCRVGQRRRWKGEFRFQLA